MNSIGTGWARQFIPCVIFLAGEVGRVDEGVEILARIQAGGDVNDPLVVAEWEDINMILAAERGGCSLDSLCCDFQSALSVVTPMWESRSSTADTWHCS